MWVGETEEDWERLGKTGICHAKLSSMLVPAMTGAVQWRIGCATWGWAARLLGLQRAQAGVARLLELQRAQAGVAICCGVLLALEPPPLAAVSAMPPVADDEPVA